MSVFVEGLKGAKVLVEGILGGEGMKEVKVSGVRL